MKREAQLHFTVVHNQRYYSTLTNKGTLFFMKKLQVQNTKWWVDHWSSSNTHSYTCTQNENDVCVCVSRVLITIINSKKIRIRTCSEVFKNLFLLFIMFRHTHTQTSVHHHYYESIKECLIAMECQDYIDYYKIKKMI